MSVMQNTHEPSNDLTVKKPQERICEDGVVSVITLWPLIKLTIRLWFDFRHYYESYVSGLNPYLHKVGVLGISDRHHGVHFLNQLLLLIIIKLHVPLGQPCLPRSVLDEDEADLKESVCH